MPASPQDAKSARRLVEDDLKKADAKINEEEVFNDDQ